MGNRKGLSVSGHAFHEGLKTPQPHKKHTNVPGCSSRGLANTGGAARPRLEHVSTKRPDGQVDING